jgi:hypothetical protein
LHSLSLCFSPAPRRSPRIPDGSRRRVTARIDL